jgi:hypothetical protein
MPDPDDLEDRLVKLEMALFLLALFVIPWLVLLTVTQ